LPLQVQLRSLRDRSFASCKRYFGYNRADYLPLQVQLRSLPDRSFASCKRYFGYSGARYLPVQVQFRSSRDRSFASCKRSLRPNLGLRRERSRLHTSVLCMYICMKACMKVCFCMKARIKRLAKIMQRTANDQNLNLSGENMRWLKSDNTEVHMEIPATTRWSSIDIETNWYGVVIPKSIIESLSSGWNRELKRL
jgi:hypothetical protein